MGAENQPRPFVMLCHSEERTRIKRLLISIPVNSRFLRLLNAQRRN